MGLFPYQIQDVKPQSELPWNIAMVNAPSFWQKTKGDGVVVAVVDTGIDATHSEFTGRLLPGKNFTSDSAKDVEGHGTHVAGIIAGATCGVAPGVRIMPLKVFGSGDGFQFQDSFRFIREYNKTAAQNDKVVAVNCSWGGGNDPVLNYMIRELVSDGVGVIVSAGNSGDGDPATNEIFSYPGFLWEPITVGALNQDGQPAGYSSSYDGIDLGAPGTQIYSSWPGGGYKLLSGTSMSAPHVTGAYALLVAAFKQREGRLPTGDEVEKILFKHIKATGVDERLSGAGILDLTYATNRWPLYRVQTNAFFEQTNQEKEYALIKSLLPKGHRDPIKVKY